MLYNLYNNDAFDKACDALALDKHTCSELDWVTMQSANTILFYDEGQSIKPSDAKKEGFDNDLHTL